MLPSPVRRLLARLAAAALLVGGLVAPVSAQSTEARPVFDASSWADVMGELRPYWNAFKAEQQANGVTWNDTGQITSIEGGRLVSATRSDAVPQEAIPRVVALDREAGVLVAESSGAAAVMRVQEAERAASAGDEDSVGGGDGPFGTGGDGDSGAEDEDDTGEDGDGDPDAQDSEDPDTDGDGVPDSEDEDDDGDGISDAEDDDADGDGVLDEDEAVEDGATGEGDDVEPIEPDADDDLGTVGDGTEEEDPPAGDSETGETEPEDVPDLDEGIDLGGGEAGESFEDIAYGTQHSRQVLDLHLPPGDGPFPVVIFFHGGAFVAGDKSQASGFMPLVEAGYALASANYKLLNKTSFGQVNFLDDAGEIAKAAYDARAAVRWLKDNAGEYNLDASNMAAVGASAGGYLAATVGACGNNSTIRNESASSNTTARVKATVDWFGPTDFATFMQDSGQQVPAPGGFTPSLDMIRGVLNDNGAVSPVEFVNAGDPPHMIRHGEIDDVVPIGQSDSYAAALRQAGVSVDYVRWPAQGHGAPSNLVEEVGLIIDFLDQHLQ